MHPDFRLPGRSRITGRKSTITGLFYVTITPVVEPSEDDVRNALHVLGMKEGHCVCAYCGDRHTEWDHLRPIVKDREPTGYITEISNLVPSCSKCNQSKGNKPWHDWINSNAKLSPKTRGIADLQKRIKHLKDYEKWRTPKPLNYQKIVGAEAWERHMKHLKVVIKDLAQAEKHADTLRKAVAAKMANKC